MTSEAVRAAELDDLLERWHRWQQDYRPTKGFRSRALVCGDYQPGKGYDHDNGADDDAVERRTMRAVDYAVAGLPEMERIAIAFEARNLAAGATVFVAMRLPADREQRAAIVKNARSMLTRKLLQAGIM